MVVYINDPSITIILKDVDVKITGEETLKKNGYVVTGRDDLPYMSVKVSGRRSDLIDYMDKVYIKVDVSKATIPGEQEFLTEDGISIEIKYMYRYSDKEAEVYVARRNIVKIFGNEEITNLFLVEKNCEMIADTFSKEDNIERMYINFCNPWPKDKHKKRRLTFPKKLMMYRDFLPMDSEIRFKTDDDNLFEESLEYFKECGFMLKDVTYDLHSSNIDGGPMTEHEKMFSDQGIKIKYLTAVKKPLNEV